MSESIRFGCPSCSFFTISTAMPASVSARAVPEVAISSKPIATSRRARPTIISLACGLATLRKILPFCGSRMPAAIWLLAKAMLKRSLTPITSPVLRISGPSTMSTPANFTNGKTLSFTLTCAGTGSESTPCSASVMPAIAFTATFATGRPVALATNGTVRLARGFTSITYSVGFPSSFLTANCTFMRPTTLRARAMLIAAFLISSTTSTDRLCGGMQQAESPE